MIGNDSRRFPNCSLLNRWKDSPLSRRHTPQPYTNNAVAFFAPVASLYAVRRRLRFSASIYREGGGQHRGHVLRPVALTATGWECA